MSKLRIVRVSSTEPYLLMAWMVCLVGTFFYCYEYILRIGPGIIGSNLMSEFHLSASQYGTFGSYYYYAYVPLQLIVGILLDRYGPRRLLIGACLLCIFGSLSFSSAHSLLGLKISRFLIGFGSSFAFVGALKAATLWFPPRNFAAVSGVITSSGMFAAMGGAIAVNHFVGLWGWRLTFNAAGWLGFIIVFLMMIFVHDKVRVSHETYVPELSFKEVFLGMMKSLRNFRLWIIAFSGLALFAPITVFAEFWAVPYFKAYGLTGNQCAWAVAMIFLGWAPGAAFHGWISDRLRRRILFLFTGSAISAFLLIFLFFSPNLPSYLLLILMLCLGVATSSQVLVFALSREVSPQYFAATAVAITNVFVMLGGILQKAIGYLLDSFAGSVPNLATNSYSLSDFNRALMLLPALLLCGLATLTIYKIGGDRQ